MATQIFERSDPRVKQQLLRIEQLSSATKSRQAVESPPGPAQTVSGRTPAGDGKGPDAADRGGTAPPETGASMFSATMAGGSQSAGTPASTQLPPSSERLATSDHVPVPREPTAIRRSAASGTAVGAKASASDAAGAQAGDLFAPGPAAPEQASQRAEKRPLIPAEVLAILKRREVLAGLGGLVIVVLVVVLIAARPKGPTEKEKKLHEEAAQLWKDRQLDQSEQAWRQLEQLRGSYAKEANREISQIEEKREAEKRRFEEAEALLKEQKNFAAASQAFQDVIGMNLWRADDAQRELAVAQALGSSSDIHAQEKQHFDQGEKLFQSGDYERARKEF